MTSTSQPREIDRVLEDVHSHAFHPLNEKTFTVDRNLREEGIANLDDPDWKVRLLAIRDLIVAGEDSADCVARGLFDDDVQVRYVCATALGVLGKSSAVASLERVVREDPHPLARGQAIAALGQLSAEESLPLVRQSWQGDPSRDVRHRAELAVDRITKGCGTTDASREAFRTLDPETFELVEVGSPAPTFELADTTGKRRALDEIAEDGNWTVLIWIFADWCPVCHREFAELIAMREAFADAGVAVATLECHDRYRARVMVGQEVDPAYWFAEESFQKTYTQRIWWPHLIDQAGAVGATYGVDPMAFAVHAEYINRPATIAIDPAGVVRFAYHGTFWGDRPSIEETLELIVTEDFHFEHPGRLVT